jgi:hypothetical protein
MRRSLFLKHDEKKAEQINWSFKVKSLRAAAISIKNNLEADEEAGVPKRISEPKKKIIDDVLKHVASLEELGAKAELTKTQESRVEKLINKIILGLTILKNDTDADLVAKLLWNDSDSDDQFTDEELASVADLTTNRR